MPPIDPSIPLRATNPRQRDRDPMRDYANMLQISEFQDKRDKRNAFEQAAQGAVGPDGQIDYDALKGAMAQSGNVMGAVDLDTKLGQRKKAGLDAETAQYNLARQRLGMMAQVFGQARDPQSWQRGRAFLSQQGIDVSEVPEQFDPAFAQDAVRQSLSAKDQLDQMWKNKEFGLKERRTVAAEQGKMGSSVNVNTGSNMPQVGTIPQGFQLEQTPEGAWRMAPIPGGPAAAEREALEAKAAGAQESEQQTAGVVLEDVGRAKEIIKQSPTLTTGFLGPIIARWGGTPAANLGSLIDTIGANISFDKLNQMRANSPTGGALGNVTERELELLAATAGSLKQSQSAEQLTQNLQRLEQQFQQVVHGGAAGNPPAQTFPGNQELAPPPGVDPQIWQFMTPEERALFQ